MGVQRGTYIKFYSEVSHENRRFEAKKTPGLEKVRKSEKGDLKPKMARVVAHTPQKHHFDPHVDRTIQPNPEKAQDKHTGPTPTQKQSMCGVHATLFWHTPKSALSQTGKRPI